ncbi:snoRNA binding domain [Trypanosoma vivax]|uniref:Putative trans-splicing factor n=1 Tax=Trypanosoma vivax (strain Y486) TaxID=1055687 RepID=G0U7Z2_TRYVY|nr:putative trans-splicing factor [Trypanosoma vivax]KAH8606351.1 snoRNA binding domain [Trypanosoma vivax]CCC52000.1 putative trans-splicing factor [Trypanosoma vivax Y486]
MDYSEAGWDGFGETQQRDRVEAADVYLEETLANSQSITTDEDARRFDSVKEVTTLLRSAYMGHMLQKLGDYSEQEVPKNAITPDDPEYQFVIDSATLVLRMEVEKSKAVVYLRAHYNQRFPELPMFFTSGIVYARVVQLLQNNMDLSLVVDKLDELVPSQLAVVIIACASTTNGRELLPDELKRVLEACQEIETLETAKQTFLEYIQRSMPLICPNLCAFLGTGITSQLFAIAGGVAPLAAMDPTELVRLGSARANSDGGGVALKTTGFLSNSDFVANHPPQLRPRALRLVATTALMLARIDANRRAASHHEGVRQREFVRQKMLAWLDPPVVRGAGNNMYERRRRKRPRRNK